MTNPELDMLGHTHEQNMEFLWMVIIWAVFGIIVMISLTISERRKKNHYYSE
jgi:hypothetical protein